MTKSFLLDNSAWDMVLDAAGNWAICTEPYSLAQDVACALRTYLGEVYYDTSLGVPYFQQILGGELPLSMVAAILEEQARTVPGVVAAACSIISVADRKLTGQIQITDINGVITNATL